MGFAYFVKQFIVYFLLTIWFLFTTINNSVHDFSGKNVSSTVKFVYEAF